MGLKKNITGWIKQSLAFAYIHLFQQDLNAWYISSSLAKMRNVFLNILQRKHSLSQQLGLIDESEIILF